MHHSLHRVREIGYHPSGFPFNTHVAQLVWTGVIHDEIGAGQGKQEHEADQTCNHVHSQLLSLLNITNLDEKRYIPQQYCNGAAIHS